MAELKLPSNAEVEKTVLGTALVNEEAVADVLGSLTEDDFYEGNLPNKLIFRAIRSLQDRQVAVDFKTVYDELVNMKALDLVGGVAYLQEVADSSMGYVNLDHYIQILKDQTTLRNFLKTMDDIIKQYQTEEITDIPDFVAIGADKINQVAEKRRISTFRTSAEIARIVVEQMEKMKQSGDSMVTGLPTGYSRLNRVTHGFQPGNMIVIAARPSIGKTAFALNVAMNAAEREHKPVAIFSLEMPAEQLMRRLIASRSNVELNKIQTNVMNAKERRQVQFAINELTNIKLYIDDTSSITLQDIVTKSRKLKKAHDDLAMVIVDHIGLIASSPNRRYESRALEVGEISRTLKELSRELKIPVVAVSQLSRKPEERTNKRPMLSDLRESGNIEQDADVVLLMYRDDYYKTQIGTDKKKTQISESAIGPAGEAGVSEERKEEIDEERSITEIMVAKNRNGPTTRFVLFFWRKFGRFDEPTEEYEREYLATLDKRT
ncbi:MAG: replicative DNA helicase [Erysipelotrichaceae bacterium]|nr:replicative DNA helicase [Erysipelotrichaceae bacterium]